MLSEQLQKTIRDFKATAVTTAIGLVAYVILLIADLDLIERVVVILQSFEQYEVDELLILVVIPLSGLAYDLITNNRLKKHQIEVQQQRLRVLKATMRTVHHIVNNFLNNLQIIRMESERSQALPPKSLEKMDAMIQQTTTKLKILGDLDGTPEIQIAPGIVAIDDTPKATANQSSHQKTSAEEAIR